MRRDTHKQAEPKATYRVKNWAQYNAGLIARGDVTMWIDEGMCKASAAQARKRGHPLVGATLPSTPLPRPAGANGRRLAATTGARWWRT
nr:hypothetical protein [Ralstonia solanacearum]